MYNNDKQWKDCENNAISNWKIFSVVNGLYSTFERKRRLPSIQLMADAKAIDQRITRKYNDDFDCWIDDIQWSIYDDWFGFG